MTAKTLSMMKMEKNYIAHLDKKYPRKPYEEYPIFIRGEAHKSLIGFVWREQIELNVAVDLLEKNIANFNRVKVLRPEDIRDQIIKAMWEVADVSNTLDYLFEGLTLALETWKGDQK